ncbi:pyridoxamine 5'-phosphate oxidase family protein [Paenibacillus sp. N1-5-1-14]|uniref:HugZ family pyridoxamine 5'-phosphate oxidase n=1 Tax=Paenibacillus radicibacter TaxID=2972488 RepID=UPI0021593CF6|nr:pyridoxamine 5'-phosphate oxidase family protein [Paenibacillus radicibacter]MCR8644514.1 pyridoxamine 5'-phosphate oxidase family protein [Paenibacillus radicibacter]
MKPIDTATMKVKFQEFIGSRKTLMISSQDETGAPFISYAPFVKVEGNLYIYISKISDHFRYVEENERIHVMMIADESETPNAFARERARYACSTENLGNEGNEEIFEQFNTKFSDKMMNMLRGLDFSLFKLTPLTGRFVVGFGQAYDVDITGEKFEHIVVDKKDK